MQRLQAFKFELMPNGEQVRKMLALQNAAWLEGATQAQTFLRRRALRSIQKGLEEDDA